jgi:hypothetical protein
VRRRVAAGARAPHPDSGLARYRQQHSRSPAPRSWPTAGGLALASRPKAAIYVFD